MEPARDALERSQLKVAGRHPPAEGTDPAREPGEPAAGDSRLVPPERVPSVGGGYDRVGGSRLTGPGAVLLAVVIAGAFAPPQATDHHLLSVTWAALVAIFVIGVAAPILAIRRIQVDARTPRDATVGETTRIDVALTGRSAGCEVRALDPTGPWQRATAPSEGQLLHLADRRGLFGGIRIEVRVTAPFGVLAAHRVHFVQLPHAVEVAPRSLAVTWLPSPAPIEGSVHPGPVAAPSGDLVRSVRPYRTGDPAHLVHWPSTARLGSLVVREMEPPVPVGQAIVVDLRDLGDDTERAAAYALGAACPVLAEGGELVMATCEADGPVVGEVRTVVDAGRRLARAVPGPPAAPPVGWPVVEIGR